MDFNFSAHSRDTTVVVAQAGDLGGLSSALHRGNFMESQPTGVKKVEDLGAVKEMQLPASWRRFDNNLPQQTSVVFQRPNNDSTKIGFIERDRPVPANSAAAFKSIVDASLAAPRVLYSDDQPNTAQNSEMFKALASALGLTTVGDNQLTSPAADPGSRQPAFHLSRARVVDVNGKKAIAIDGWYGKMDDQANVKMTTDGPDKRYYSGLFIDASGQGTKVDELYMTAEHQASFVANKDVFSAATKSIKWR